MDVNQEKLFSGQISTRIVIGLVRNDAFNGSTTQNPFNFQNFRLTEISVYSDRQQQHGIKPLTTDFERSMYVRGFNTLFSGTGKVFRDEGNALDGKNFSGGYALYAFELTSDLGEDDYFSLAKQGSVRLVLKFAQPLTDPVTVIAYATSSRSTKIATSFTTLQYEHRPDGSHHSSLRKTIRRCVQQRSFTDKTEADGLQYRSFQRVW